MTMIGPADPNAASDGSAPDTTQPSDYLAALRRTPTAGFGMNALGSFKPPSAIDQYQANLGQQAQDTAQYQQRNQAPGMVLSPAEAVSAVTGSTESNQFGSEAASALPLSPTGKRIAGSVIGAAVNPATYAFGPEAILPQLGASGAQSAAQPLTDKIKNPTLQFLAQQGVGAVGAGATEGGLRLLSSGLDALKATVATDPSIWGANLKPEVAVMSGAAEEPTGPPQHSWTPPLPLRPSQEGAAVNRASGQPIPEAVITPEQESAARMARAQEQIARNQPPPPIPPSAPPRPVRGPLDEPSPEPLHPVTAEEQLIARRAEAITPKSGVSPGAPALPNGMEATPLGMESRGLPPPPAGGLPSGRLPGGPQNQFPASGPSEYEKWQAALNPPREPWLKTAIRNVPMQLSDRTHPLAELSDQTGIPAHELALAAPHAVQYGTDIAQRYFDPVVKSVGADSKQLEAYMTMMHGKDVAQLPGNRWLPGGANPTKIESDAIQGIIDRVGMTRFHAIQTAANAIQDVRRQWILQPLVDEGILNANQYRDLVASHPNYIPYARDAFDTGLREQAGSAPASLSTTTLKTMDEAGSTRALDNPLQRLRAQIIGTQMAVAKNKAGRAATDALQMMDNGSGELVRKIGTAADALKRNVTGETVPTAAKGESSKEWETVSHFDNGVKQSYQVPAEIGRVMRDMGEEPAGALRAIANIMNAPFRAGVVAYNPFAIPRFAMHHLTNAMMTEGLNPVSLNYARALRSAWLKDADYMNASKAGALVGQAVDTMRNADAQRLGAKSFGEVRLENWKDLPLLPARLMAAVGSHVNTAHTNLVHATDIAVFNKLKAAGLSDAVSAARASNAGLDFSKAGLAVRWMNNFVPFLNPAVQGSISFVKGWKEHPVRSAALTAMFSVPSAFVAANNARFQTSKDIPDAAYALSWPLQIGEIVKGDGTRAPLFIPIPKGMMGSLLSAPADAVLMAARHAGDQSVVKTMMEALANVAGRTDFAGVAGTGNPLSRNPLTAAAAGALANKNPYNGIPIVPQSQATLTPNLQYGATTSRTAIAAGQINLPPHLSPDMIDFILNDLTGTTGGAINAAASAALGAAGYNPPVYGSGRPQAAQGALKGSAAKEPTAAIQPSAVQRITQTPGLSSLLSSSSSQETNQGYQDQHDDWANTSHALHTDPKIVKAGLSPDLLPLSAPLLSTTPGAPTGSGASVTLEPLQMAAWQKGYDGALLQNYNAVKDLFTGDPAHDKPIWTSLNAAAKDDALQPVLDAMQPPTDPVAKAAWGLRKVMQSTRYQDIEADDLAKLPANVQRLYAQWKLLGLDPARAQAAGGTFANPQVSGLMTQITAKVNADKVLMQASNPSLDAGLVRFYGMKPQTDTGRAVQALLDRQKAA